MGHDHLAHPHWVQDPFSSPSFTQQGKPPTPMFVACCLLLCDSCFVPSMPFPSPRSVAFVQSSQCFSFTLLSIAPHPGTQTAPGSHLSSLLALSQPLISYPYLPLCSLFQLLLLFFPSGNLPLLHPKRISPLIPSTVLPSIYHWLIYHQPYAPKPSFQGSLGQIHEASACEGLLQRQAWDCACRDGHACPGIHVFLPAHSNTYMLLPTFPLPDPRLWDFKGSSCSPMGHRRNLRSTAAGWDLGCLVLQSLD